MLLEVVVEDSRVFLKPLDLWDRVWRCGKGKGLAEEAELELDREEKDVLEAKKSRKVVSAESLSLYMKLIVIE